MLLSSYMCWFQFYTSPPNVILHPLQQSPAGMPTAVHETLLLCTQGPNYWGTGNIGDAITVGEDSRCNICTSSPSKLAPDTSQVQGETLRCWHGAQGSSQVQPCPLPSPCFVCHYLHRQWIVYGTWVYLKLQWAMLAWHLGSAYTIDTIPQESLNLPLPA